MVALAGAVGPVACSDGNSGPPPIDDVSDVLDVYQDFYTFYCECYGDVYGDAGVDACLSEYGDLVSDSEEACITAVFDANPAAFEILRCQAEAVRGLLGCQQAAGCPASFECGDGTTVPVDFVCDGEPDCSNGSDEAQSCPAPPMCADGQPLATYSVCDGFEDCADGSDEVGCPAPFVCGDGSEIPNEWVCDGGPDCEDGSDEQQMCPVTCESKWETQLDACGDLSDDVQTLFSECFDFACLSGLEIPAEQVCDGAQDCPQGDDEQFCSMGGSTGG